MIRVLYRHRTTGIVDEILPERLPAALKDKMLNLWIDMLDPTAEESAFVFEQRMHRGERLSSEHEQASNKRVVGDLTVIILG